MVARLVELTSVFGHPLYINPDHVVMIQAHASAKENTDIWLNGVSTVVREPLSEVLFLLPDRIDRPARATAKTKPL